MLTGNRQTDSRFLTVNHDGYIKAMLTGEENRTAAKWLQENQEVG